MRIYQRIAWKYGLYSKWQSDFFDGKWYWLNLAFLVLIWLLPNFVLLCNTAVWSNAVDRIRLLQKLFFRIFLQIDTRFRKNSFFEVWIDQNAVLLVGFKLRLNLNIWQKWSLYIFCSRTFKYITVAKVLLFCYVCFDILLDVQRTMSKKMALVVSSVLKRMLDASMFQCNLLWKDIMNYMFFKSFCKWKSILCDVKLLFDDAYRKWIY